MDVHAQLSAQFYGWERRGRGWMVWPEPVRLEPPFLPLQYALSPSQDDGRRPSFLGSLLRGVVRGKQPPAPAPAPPPSEEEPPASLTREDLTELRVALPANLELPKDSYEPFLRSISHVREPVAFELLGLADSISLQYTTHPRDAAHVRRQLAAFFPDAAFEAQEGRLEESWLAVAGKEALVVEFGLAREFVFPLGGGRLDPFVGLVGALSELEPDELGLYQVIFESVEKPWAESIIDALTSPDGAPRFVNARELTEAAEEKASHPLFAAVVRIGVKSRDFDRCLEIAGDLAGTLGVFARQRGNELIPLTNDEYPFEGHVEDLVRRQTRRSGMLLNSDELIGFVHLPSLAVRTSRLLRQQTKSKPAPRAFTQRTDGIVLGKNIHGGQALEVRLSDDARASHMHVIGASGTGKSTLLFNLISQDLEKGHGFAVLDPHGDLIERILGTIPEERIDDVVLIDPADEAYPVGFNILSAHNDLEKTLLASDLVSVFERLSASWGDQMGSVFQNAVLAFLESSEGGTLSDLRRFLIEPAFRERFLGTVRDPDVLYYWQKAFPQLTGNKSIGPVLTRLGTFLAPKPVRYMVSQRVNRLDFREIMDRGKILLAKLSQGQIGKENAFLLGSLFVAKFQETAISRQALETSARRPFWLYIDEFQNFISPSMAEILTGARKYGLGLILAHHGMRQLQSEPDLASAVFNAYTRICFRLGDDDARKLAEGFASFDARDLQNLDRGQAICRLERSDCDFNLSISAPKAIDPVASATLRERVVARSRMRYGTPRADVETMLREALGLAEVEVRKQAPPPTSPGAPAPPPSAPPPPAPTSEPQPTKPPEAVPAPELPAPQPPGSLEEDVPGVVKPVEPAAPETRRKSAGPAEQGRGGAQHRAIVDRIKAAAESLGYRATVEKAILENSGSIDLALEKSVRSFACEVTISTTVDHEVGNIIKCFKAGFGQVVSVSPDEGRLRKIREAVSGALGKTEADRVMFLAPDEFIELLQRLDVEDAKSPPEPERRRGYVIKRSVAKLSPEERRAREEVALKILAELMKRRGRSKDK